MAPGRIAALAYAGLTCAALHGCGDDEGEVRFEIAFERRELLQRAAVIEARIARGGCDSDSLVYASTFAPDEEGMRPPALGGGRYAFQARAQDRECFWYAQGCREVTLPGGGGAVAIELAAIDTESRDCDAPACRAAACESPPDAGPDAQPPAGGSGARPDGAVPAAGSGGDDDAGALRDAGSDAAAPPPITILIEAEEAETLTLPLERVDDPSASGGAGVTYPYDPDEITLTERQSLKRAVPPTDDDAGGIALYRFELPRAGRFRLWGRVITRTLDEDSFWLRIDDRDWLQWNDIAHSDTWFWVDIRPFEQRIERYVIELGAGPHELRLSYREIGAHIDQLVLTSELDFVPGTQ